MVVAYRDSSQVYSASNSETSKACPRPPALQVDDLMLAFVSVSGTQTMTEVPTGWLPLGDFPAIDSSSGVSNLWVYYKYAKAADLTTSTYQWTWANAGGGIIAIVAYSGARIATGKYAKAVRASTTTAMSTGSITTTAVAWIISAFADANGSTWTVGDTSRQARTRTSAASLVVQDTNGTVAAGTYTKTATGSVSTNVATAAIIAIEAGGPPSDAGADQTVEPDATVTLTGTGTTATWSQTGGTPSGIPLGGSGATRTFVAPRTLNGTTLTFDYGGDTMTVTVLPWYFHVWDGAAWQEKAMTDL